MEPTTQTLQAMQHCKYKAWQLSKDPEIENGEKGPAFKPNAKLLSETTAILNNEQPPAFYKIPHCAECRYKNDCYKKLKERDCISLLAGMTPKTLNKYHSKGITTITQLSYLFKPRRRGRIPKNGGSYPFELKALAIREQKTFVMHLPELPQQPQAIYMDFEGLPDEKREYLLGAYLFMEVNEPVYHAFWSDDKLADELIFKQLFTLLTQYPDAPIYHYGSYEHRILKQAVKKWPKALSRPWPGIEKRMVNLLSFLRTHIYPPTYGNGLKEVGSFLNFNWSDKEADGFLSIHWRKQWELSQAIEWKDKLLQYNRDDCEALYHVHRWLSELASGSAGDIQQVAQMKKHTPYRLQSNADYGEDFQLISKAAYFDYQRSKIYWRNELKKQTPAASPANGKPKTQRGTIAWQPKKVNEIVIVPPLKKCPHCGHTKLYQSHTTKTSVKQTDLKFTVSGVKQHVTEYRSGTAKCAKCGMKTGNKNLRMMHYGDNLFALIINYYVNYHISNAMISNLIQEHYGIWIATYYLVNYKPRWWNRTWSPVAEYTKAIVLNSPVIHIDETTIKLDNESGYVWVFATTHSVFYHYTSTREADFLKPLLKNYQGIVISDFFPGYETLAVKRQKCLIHLIRDLNDDLFKNQFDGEYKLFVAAFSTLLRKIVVTIDKRGLKKVYLEKHLPDTTQFYNAFIDKEYKSELASKYAKRLKKHWEQLWTFLHHDNVPWNNNNAEAGVKAFAQHRRGVKGQMSVKGVTDYLQMLTVAQTCRYRNISFLSFLQRKKGIWENVQPEALPGFLPFEQAKLFMHRLGFERKEQWNQWKKDGNRPAFIPSSPNRTYQNSGWVDWHDWIGFDFLPFPKARTYMRKLNLKNREKYWAWLASGQRPKNIPYSPEKVYKHTGWIDLGDWLGNGNKSGQQKWNWLTYGEAKAYVQALGIKTQHEYFAWRSSGKRPATIPSAPNKSYKEFEGWGEFLGTDRIANQCKEYWDYERAKDFLKPLYIRSQQHFRQLHGLGLIPKEIPKNPYAYYKKHRTWIGFKDFFNNNLF